MRSEPGEDGIDPRAGEHSADHRFGDFRQDRVVAAVVMTPLLTHVDQLQQTDLITEDRKPAIADARSSDFWPTLSSPWC